MTGETRTMSGNAHSGDLEQPFRRFAAVKREVHDGAVGCVG
jgi:hypothetical protein